MFYVYIAMCRVSRQFILLSISIIIAHIVGILHIALLRCVDLYRALTADVIDSVHFANDKQCTDGAHPNII